MIDLFETTRPKIRPEFLELAEKGMGLVNWVFNAEFPYEPDDCWTRMPWFDRIYYSECGDDVILRLRYKDECYSSIIELSANIKENNVGLSESYEQFDNIFKICMVNLFGDEAKYHISDMLKDVRQIFYRVDDGSIIDGEEVYYYDDIGHEVNKCIAHYEKDSKWSSASCIIDCAGHPIYVRDLMLIPTRHWDTEA